jgi:23S rRNA pseudouridine955/2504/2580 synthase
MNKYVKLKADAATHVGVSKAQAGQRIDNFLTRYLKRVPRSHVYRILSSGEVRVNKGRVKPSYRLEPDDRVRIPPVRTGARALIAVPEATLARLEASVLLEDEDLIVLNKPAGLAVHSGSGLDYGIIEALRQARPHAPMLELVHRLDRNTSGCLLIAKSRGILSSLHALLREGKADKRYIALLAGSWTGNARTVTAPLARLAASEQVVVRTDGKEAQSVFTPLTRFKQSTLVEVRIDTGRMHQIRVHAAHLGIPVAGDARYGDYAFNRALRARGLRRMFLHAVRLSFRMPQSGRRYSIVAPLDAQLQRLLTKLS